MKDNIYSVLIGGEAGQGVRMSGILFSRIMNKVGRHVFEMDDYPSLIRGGHNASLIASSIKPVFSHYEQVHVFACLDDCAYEIQKDKVRDDGTLVYNSDAVEGAEGIPIPVYSWIKEEGNNPVLAGTIGVASACALGGVDFAVLEESIREAYPKYADPNVRLAKKTYDAVSEHIGKYQIETGDGKLGAVMTGNEAISLGAVAGGMKCYIAYPMTPMSSVLHYLAAQAKRLGIVVSHPESEIAAINMAIGCAYTGVKTMIGSSGGGFALMQEAFSLAGQSETPLLCYLGTRPGPSTGVPTYTSQGDLNFALYQGHGEFSRIVMSPADNDQAFTTTAELMNLLWRYQIPGILLTEKHLAESTMTTRFDFDSIKTEELLMYDGNPEDYGRYKITESGMSPMLFPPVENAVIKATSYEHDENGITTEDPQAIVAMMEKRARKRKAIEDGLRQIKTVETEGDGKIALVTYGSTTCSVREAAKYLDDVRIVQVIYLEPFPIWAVEEALQGAEKIVTIELSIDGQFTTLLKQNGIKADGSVRKYDGRPFDPLDLAKQIKEVI
ncbi:MAG: 2-oxoacid:acceptor oxidoreductase subunit alpha [Thermoplasmata archaeon]|nr:2-oxoacid:acceptor oxidoreductase subunit alpha [Thermoplasmata archaeon]